MRKENKKELKTGFVYFVLLPVVLIFLTIGIFATPVLIDNIACTVYKNRIIKSIMLPENAIVIDTVSGCGNTSGTGNHTESYVAVLVKSDTPLNRSELSKTVNVKFDDFDVFSFKEPTFTPGAVSVSFVLSEEQNIDDYYVLWFCRRAPMSWLDIRGS